MLLRTMLLRLLYGRGARAFVAFEARLDAAGLQAGETLRVACETVLRFDRTYPDWLEITRREAAVEDMRRWIRRQGGPFDDALVRTLVQFGIEALRYENAGGDA